MAKPKRVKKQTVRYIYEGKTEKCFLEHLKSFHPNSAAQEHFIFSGSGGSADAFVLNAIKISHSFDRVFLILDEDFQNLDAKYRVQCETFESLGKAWGLCESEAESLEKLHYRELHTKNPRNRNPIIIFSNPASIEGIILQILGIAKESLEGKSSDDLKGMLSGHDRDLQKLLEEHVTLEILQERRQIIRELDEILKMFENSSG